MGIVQMLLSLKASKQMLALPRLQNAPLEALMRDLREQAQRKAKEAPHMPGSIEHEHWQIVAMYAKYVARAFKRENMRRDKAEVVAGLLDSIGISAAPTLPKSVRQYAGSEAMKTPSAKQSNCLIEVAGREFRPWADKGDLLQIDFSMTHLHGDSLYLVAVDHYLQLTGFRKTPGGWYAMKNHYDDPELVEMIEDRLPSRYEIVGRVVHIFKGPDLNILAPKQTAKRK